MPEMMGNLPPTWIDPTEGGALALPSNCVFPTNAGSNLRRLNGLESIVTEFRA